MGVVERFILGFTALLDHGHACELDAKHGSEDLIYSREGLCYHRSILEVEVRSFVTRIVVVLPAKGRIHRLEVGAEL